MGSGPRVRWRRTRGPRRSSTRVCRRVACWFTEPQVFLRHSGEGRNPGPLPCHQRFDRKVRAVLAGHFDRAQFIDAEERLEERRDLLLGRQVEQRPQRRPTPLAFAAEPRRIFLAETHGKIAPDSTRSTSIAGGCSMFHGMASGARLPQIPSICVLMSITPSPRHQDRATEPGAQGPRSSRISYSPLRRGNRTAPEGGLPHRRCRQFIVGTPACLRPGVGPGPAPGTLRMSMLLSAALSTWDPTSDPRRIRTP